VREAHYGRAVIVGAGVLTVIVLAWLLFRRDLRH